VKPDTRSEQEQSFLPYSANSAHGLLRKQTAILDLFFTQEPITFLNDLYNDGRKERGKYHEQDN